MKSIKINIDDISEFELNLAQSERVIAYVDDIVQLSLKERKQRLETLKKNVREGAASLFEEKVLAKLLEPRTAERIKMIHRNLSQIEKEFQKRKISPAPPVKSSTPPHAPPSPPAQTARPGKYPSELIERKSKTKQK